MNILKPTNIYLIQLLLIPNVKSIFMVNASTQNKVLNNEMIIFDFNNNPDISSWTEQSDTVRKVGKSKAAFVMQTTEIFQRVVLFTLLNPQPNGAGFAGVRTNVELDLSQFKSIALRARGNGENYGYKVVLRHKHENDEPYPSYCHYFTATKDFNTIEMKLKDFKPYYRGKLVNDSEPLDTSQITNFGLQIYGGVYLPIKQSGVSSLEIDWISALGD